MSAGEEAMLESRAGVLGLRLVWCRLCRPDGVLTGADMACLHGAEVNCKWGCSLMLTETDAWTRVAGADALRRDALLGAWGNSLFHARRHAQEKKRKAMRLGLRGRNRTAGPLCSWARRGLVGLWAEI